MPAESPDPHAAPNRAGEPASPPVSADVDNHDSRRGQAEDPLDVLGHESDAAALVGLVIADRYRVVELLGQGGMGAVYRADHVHIRKSFAVKVLHRELTHHAEAVKRFEREAIAAARIDHPNVAAAIDFGQLESGAFYLVLDYVQGRSLRKLLLDEGRLPEARAIRIARQVASALSAAHAADIVHRDLKPDNVMLVESNAEPDFVKVLDFGIAKLTIGDTPDEPAITRFGTVFGTPEYMSPEQSLGQGVDARSDLYSLGILMYEMLVGHTPFAGDQLVIVLTRQMTEPPAPLPQTVSQQTRRLVMHLLEKLPDARPANAEVVVATLDGLGGTTPGNFGHHPRTLDEVQPMTSDAHQALANGATLYADVPGPMSSGALNRISTQQLPDEGAAYSLVRRSMRAPSLPPWIRKQVVVAGHHIPVAVMAMGATLVLGGILGTLAVWAVLGRQNDEIRPSTVSPGLSQLLGESAESKQLKAWIEQTNRGDPAALQQLELRPLGSRTPEVWAAIGAGRAQAKLFTPSVEAYNRALSTDPRFASSKRVQSDLYQAALDAQSSAAALETAAQYLGTAGADLIYAALEASQAGRAPKVDRRKAKALLESASVTSQVSPALRVAIKLESAHSCNEFRNLLPEVESSGDTRCQRTLRKLTHDRGCGLLGLMDCYSCLRSSRSLAAAIEATKSRSSPTFLPTLPEGAPAGGPR